MYKKGKGTTVICNLCSHYCSIPDSGYGRCLVRRNKGGRLYSLSYGDIIARQVDPIEKKPLFHFYPGTLSYSIAAAGCNFQCDFCQNWQISQKKEAERCKVRGTLSAPEEVVESALRANCESIAYTYTEPTIYFEFAYECAQRANAHQLSNVFVTNGYMTQDAIEYINPYLDAANIDLKSFRDSFYLKRCKASLKPVLASIQAMRKLDIWIEITTLIVPGCNDSEEELSDIASFIASVGCDIPWHISRFYPQYKMGYLSPTPLSIMEKAYQIGKSKGLHYVYLGNIATDYGENTYCHSCNELLIQRAGFYVEKDVVVKGKCPACQTPIAGRGLSPP